MPKKIPNSEDRPVRLCLLMYVYDRETDRPFGASMKIDLEKLQELLDHDTSTAQAHITKRGTTKVKIGE